MSSGDLPAIPDATAQPTSNKGSLSEAPAPEAPAEPPPNDITPVPVPDISTAPQNEALLEKEGSNGEDAPPPESAAAEGIPQEPDVDLGGEEEQEGTGKASNGDISITPDRKISNLKGNNSKKNSQSRNSEGVRINISEDRPSTMEMEMSNENEDENESNAIDELENEEEGAPGPDKETPVTNFGFSLEKDEEIVQKRNIESMFGLPRIEDESIEGSDKQSVEGENKKEEEITFTDRLPKQWNVNCGKNAKDEGETFFVELSPQNSAKDMKDYRMANYALSVMNDKWRLEGSVRAFRGSTAHTMSVAASHYTIPSQTVVSKYKKSHSRLSSMISIRSLGAYASSRFDQTEEPIWQRGRHFDHATEPNKKHFISIINTLNYDIKVLEATQSTLLRDIQSRYKSYNANIENYRWTDIYEKPLDFEFTLHENGLVDSSYITDEVGLDYYPIILLFFNDGFENDPPMQLDIRKAFIRDADILCRNYQLGLLPHPRVKIFDDKENPCRTESELGNMTESERELALEQCAGNLEDEVQDILTDKENYRDARKIRTMSTASTVKSNLSKRVSNAPTDSADQQSEGKTETASEDSYKSPKIAIADTVPDDISVSSENALEENLLNLTDNNEQNEGEGAASLHGSDKSPENAPSLENIEEDQIEQDSNEDLEPPPAETVPSRSGSLIEAEAANANINESEAEE